ncbi:MAG TPA: DUF5777 family beta-barrel protein [Prolixibacteraceae bacterium]|nr:DUF5777 family beta-barrel protein [Prolixibacteraceae bacterium]
MKNSYTLLIALCLILGIKQAYSQDLDALLEKETSNTTDYVIATFLSNRIINGQSTEQLQKNGLDFRISHRFGSFKEGAEELYGLDGSNSYFSADYGLTDRIMIGIGRATFDKQVTGNIKAKILRQSTGAKKMPVTVSLFGEVAATTQKFSNAKRNDDFVSRLNYTGQLLIAKKMDNLSLQLSPTFVHRNLVETTAEKNDLFAVGVGGRYKLSSVFDVSAEYFWVNGKTDNSYNPLSFAVSYQVSHHVFQVILTNSQPITENSVIGKTTDSWLDGNIHVGFNISTVF